MPYLTKQFRFCAAHKYWNDNWDEKKNFSVFEDDIKVHGHNYELDITIKGSPNDQSGFIIDLSTVKDIVNEYVINILDHSQIQKDIKWFENKQPSTENLVLFIWDRLAPKIMKPAMLYCIKLRE